jgi:predicted metalloendopeptidase
MINPNNIEQSFNKHEISNKLINIPKPSYEDDFYGWANYKWIKNVNIPDDEIIYTHFVQTQKKINKQLKLILESNIYPFGLTLYESYIKSYDSDTCKNDLKILVNIVDTIKTYNDLMIIATKLLFFDVNTLFDLSVETNIYKNKEHKEYILFITQPSLGLSDREYYHNSKFGHIRYKYYDMIRRTHIELYPEMNIDDVNKIAQIIINIETQLAIILLDHEYKRNITQTYHNIDLSSMIKSYSDIYVGNIIETLSLLTNNPTCIFKSIIMEHHNDVEVNYFKQLSTILSIYTIDQWKIYFKYRIILRYMKLINQKLCDIYFDLFNKTIRGQQKPKPIHEIAVSYICSLLYDPISHIYHKKYFKENYKNYIMDMVENIKFVAINRIRNLHWLSNKTKQKATEKLQKMKLKLGYSNSNAQCFDNIKLTNSIIKNTIQLRINNFTHMINKLNKNIDTDEWHMPAYIVNAYYNPTNNEIVFPTAILQPPFIDLNKSDIYNYAHIGCIISHEIIHGFDVQGSMFDDTGLIKNWWVNDDKLKYNNKVNEIIKIYNDEGINGRLTAGENIADFGAISIAIQALQNKSQNLSRSDIRYFYKMYAHNWQYIARPAYIE